ALERDPPARRVDEVAFAAKGLADRFLAHLEELGLGCTRVLVEAETEHGERLARCWRHDGVLTPATLVTRVRWQLEAWLTGEQPDETDGAETVTAGLTKLALAPDGVLPETGRQLGFWGGDARATDRAAHALARVQGMLGSASVLQASAKGGRTPAEQVRWVPWGTPPGDAAPTAPW